MTKKVCLSVFLMMCGELTHAQNIKEFSLRAELTVARNDYLLGEPILLQLTIFNEVRSPIETSPLAINEIATEVSSEGQIFRLVDPTITLKNRVGDSVLIDPGNKKMFPVIVCVDYRRLRRDELGLPKPGTYGIRAISPFRLPGSDNPIRSNVVQVHVRQPEGDDLTIYQEIKRHNAYRLLQNGGMNWDDKKRVHFVVQFLEKYPRSGYRTALIRSLKLIIKSIGLAKFEAIFSRDEREKVRRFIGDPLPVDFKLPVTTNRRVRNWNVWVQKGTNRSKRAGSRGGLRSGLPQIRRAGFPHPARHVRISLRDGH